MLITERKPISFLVEILMSRPDIRRHRLTRIRVLFPDLGVKPSVLQMGFLRYPGEKSIVKPEATVEELSLPGGLTIHISGENEHG